MRAVKILVCCILAGALLAGCGVASQATATSFGESMKGYELYSWQDGNQWYFSVPVGTNREKTLDEIKAAGTALRGVEALASALEQMPAGQYITWSVKETLAFPPDDIIEQVEKVCTDQGLILNRAT